MTRINAGISIKRLSDQHLMAEIRELPRIFTLAKKNPDRNIPSTFKLGTGHVVFFYDKLKYLYKRYLILQEEYELRFGYLYGHNKGYHDFVLQNYNSCPGRLKNDWDDWRAKQILEKRIAERLLNTKGKHHYYRKSVSVEKIIKIFNEKFALY